MRTRIEIYRSGEWIELFLGNEKEIRYNLVANRVGSMSQREISHSNTFTLPYVHQNIQALEINVFNPRELAKAFNAKYIAKYYVNDKVNQEGFLVINNTDNGIISVNFIDGALGIVEKWGAMSYYDLLNSDIETVPEPYKSNLDSMKSYNMDSNTILTPLSNITGLDYPIAKFPNNLNAVGDKFQKDLNGVRANNTFNPYQSRPIFNVKALFDISIESFGYTPYYDDSVNWEKLQSTYMIEGGLSQGQKNEGSGDVSKVYPKVRTSTAFTAATYATPTLSYVPFNYPPEVQAGTINSVLPTNISYWSQSADWRYPNRDVRESDRYLLFPSKTNLTTGSMEWSFYTQHPLFSTPIDSIIVHSFWERKSPPEQWMTEEGEIITETVYTYFRKVTLNLSVVEATVIPYPGVRSTVIATLDKSELGVKPITVPGAYIPGSGPVEDIGDLVGLTMTVLLNNGNVKTVQTTIQDLVYRETSPAEGVVAYDKYDQYDSDTINLTHATPKSSIKDLLSAIMQKEGILMSFNNRQKTIKLFSYSSYNTRRDEGNFSDWTEFHQEYDSPLYNTDYGGEFAVINDIGLASPYPGNTYKLILENQLVSSKHKSFIQNYNKKFKDVEALSLINNSITPYYEFTNKGLGLVEVGSVGLGELTQVRADSVTQGTFTGLTPVYNVNYSDLPEGIVSWYGLVDKAVRAQATFLLPLKVIRELDLTEPIYIRKLGGFYIIEEVPEYIDAQTPVRVKLIKLLIDDRLIAPTTPPTTPHYSSQYSDSYSK